MAAELFQAVARGNREKVIKLLAKTDAIHGKNDGGYSPLHWAVLTNQREIASLLLSRGAGVNTTLPGGFTPLHDAAYSGNGAMARLLLEHGADPYAADKLGKIPLQIALEGGHADLLRQLKPLHLACEIGDLQRIKEIVSAHPSALEQRDERGSTPLHLAALNGRLEAVKLLAERGAALNARGPLGATPLRLALENGRNEIAAYLHGRGALDQSDELLLKRDLHEGEAVIWHLFLTGWAVKTRNHLLVFDYDLPQGDSVLPPAVPLSLTAGEIDPRQLKGLDVSVFSTFIRNQAHLDRIFSWKSSLAGIRYLVGEENVKSALAEHIPPRRRSRFHGLDVLAVTTNGFGQGFAVTVDGLTIFFGGDHQSGRHAWDTFAREIDYLAEAIPHIDLVFLQMMFEEEMQSSRGVLYAMETLRPAWFIPNSAVAREPFFKRFLEKAAALRLPTRIRCAENRGDLFFYPDPD